MSMGFSKRIRRCAVVLCLVSVTACMPASARSVKAGKNWNKAAAVKKGTNLVKQTSGKNGFVKFKVPSSKTWKISFKNVHGEKKKAVKGKFYLAEVNKANKIVFTNTQTKKKITYWPLCSQEGYTSGYNTYVDLQLPLVRGQVIYACYKASSPGKSLSYTLSIK